VCIKAFPHSRAIPNGDTAVDVDIRLAVYAAAFVYLRKEKPPSGMSWRDPDWAHKSAMIMAEEAVEANRRERDK
jgi:hypothetical protein